MNRPLMSRFALSLLLAAAALLVACDDDGGSNSALDADAAGDATTIDAADGTGVDTVETGTDATMTTADATTSSDTTAPTADAATDATDDASMDVVEPDPLPTRDELGTGWHVLRPGGETICAKGAEYAFGVRIGDPSKIVVDFIGGGACWNAITCGVNDQLGIFSETVDDVVSAIESGVGVGIYDETNPANPFADWTHVVVPYCTGDVHWGDAVQDYSSPLGDVTINHKGAVNTRAVLDWVYANHDSPEKIFVTGCSAGSYGSVLWTPHIAREYPEASMYQFGDSGAGIITMSFFMESFPQWNAFDAFPAFIPTLDPDQVDVFGLTFGDLYERIGAALPDSRLSQFNYTLDSTQVSFYEAMGGQGGAEGWSAQMYESVLGVRASTDNYRNYIVDDTQHCVIVADRFYTTEVGGVPLTDWLGDMVDDQPVDDAVCCTPPTP